MRRQLQVGSPELQSRLLLYCDGSVNMDSWGVCCTYGVCGSKESAYVEGLYWTHETESGASYGVPSQKLGHLGQSLLAGICEICGLPVVID